jgi:hypothetical protein
MTRSIDKAKAPAEKLGLKFVLGVNVSYSNLGLIMNDDRDELEPEVYIFLEWCAALILGFLMLIAIAIQSFSCEIV